MHKHLQFGSRRSRGSKVLELLVESGVAYCVSWVRTKTLLEETYILMVLLIGIRSNIPDYVS